ncbi:Uncharacterised protein [Vibrio cholerae]|nr:Uncharacterised protein [Vibrio cholerae]
MADGGAFLRQLHCPSQSRLFIMVDISHDKNFTVNAHEKLLVQ